MSDSRLDKLASVLVKYSTAVKKDDVVQIRGNSVAEPLILAIVRAVVKAGGHPLIRMAPGEVAEILCKHGSDEQLTYVSPLARREFSTIDVSIGIWADRNTKSMSNVDPRKQQLLSKARKPILDIFLKRASAKGKDKLRWTGTQFPCSASAQDAEMSLAEYEDFVYTAGLLHLPNPAAAWKRIHVAQQRLADVLNKAREVRFVVPGGTDLRVGVKGRKWINCSGHENFPDGEVFTGPIEDATEGTVHYTYPAVHGGREVQDVVLTFKAGKVVDARAGKNEAFLFKMMDQDRGGRILGEIAFGTNYSIKRFTRNTLFDEKIGGTFHAALGMAYPETGAKNKSGLHWDMVCDLRKGGQVEVDGKVISKNGRFLNSRFPQPGRKR
ncbi:MAG TPA: aminopeptidase [Phycisphaerae bacterium]|nr:aminopeptidase [Phycisphaerae bacterium]